MRWLAGHLPQQSVAWIACGALHELCTDAGDAGYRGGATGNMCTLPKNITSLAER